MLSFDLSPLKGKSSTLFLVFVDLNEIYGGNEIFGQVSRGGLYSPNETCFANRRNLLFFLSWLIMLFFYVNNVMCDQTLIIFTCLTSIIFGMANMKTTLAANSTVSELTRCL